MILKKIIALTLILCFVLLSSCERIKQNIDGDTAVSEGGNTIDDIPLTSTVPPYTEYYRHPDEKYLARCFIDNYEDAYDMYCSLKENGVDFLTNYASFDYEDEDVFAGYMFYGTMTEESYLSRKEKEFYELDFQRNRVYMSCYLYYKERYLNLGDEVLLGLDNFPFTEKAQILLHPRFSVEVLKTLNIQDMVLTPSECDTDTVYERYIIYKGEEVFMIVSSFPFTDDFFDKIKHTLVIFD